MVMESILATFPFFTYLISANLISSFVILLVRPNLFTGWYFSSYDSFIYRNCSLLLFLISSFLFMFIGSLPSIFHRFQVFCSSFCYRTFSHHIFLSYHLGLCDICLHRKYLKSFIGGRSVNLLSP